MRSKDKIDLIVKIDRLNWKIFNIGVTNFNIFPIGAPYELFKSFPLFICEFYNSSCRLPVPHKIGYLFLMPDFGPSWPMIKVDSLSKFQVSQHKAHTHSLSLSLSLSLFNGVVILLRPQPQLTRHQSQASLWKEAPSFLFLMLPPLCTTATPRNLSSHSHSLQKLLPSPTFGGPKPPPLHRSSFSHRLQSPAQVSNILFQ